MKASTTFQQKLGNVSKLNRPIPSSAVGAGFDTASCATLAAPGKGIKTDKGNLMIGVGDLHTPQSMKEEIIKNNRFKSHSTN